MIDKKTNTPWYKTSNRLPTGAHIAIIGGGIAGVCTYLHLKAAGFKATIIDKNTVLMGGASGNPIAILDPFLSASKSIEQKYYLQAYEYALKFYQDLASGVLVKCRLEKKAKNKEEIGKFSEISEQYARDLLRMEEDVIVLPAGGYIDPATLRNLISEDFLCEKAVTDIIQHEDLSWSVLDHKQTTIIQTDAVILANSFDLSNFDQARSFNLEQVEGQLTYVAPQFREKKIICSRGYISPAVKTEFGIAHVCGATFERQVNPTISAKAHQENMENSPYAFENPKIVGGRRAIRAMSPDHLPLCGPAPDLNCYLEDYEGLRHGPKHKEFPDATYHKNLFINAGLGSRGFVHAPLLGKYLSCIIKGEIEPLDTEISNALHPARFIIRALSKK